MGYRGGRPSTPLRSSPSAPALGLPSKLAVEFVGTGLLCFTISVVSGATAALAIGSTLMCAIYAGGHISGANYNPAVSLAIWVRGKLSFVELLAYVVTQCLAAAAAALAAAFFVATPGYPAPGPTGTGYGALVVEAVLTFALCHTVLHVATTNAQKNNSYYGLAIGFVVLSGAVSVGGVSGGAFNPAVGVLALMPGVTVMGTVAAPMATVASVVSAFMGGAWIYAAGPFAGGLAAGLLFRITHPGESENPAGAPLRGLREGIAPFLMELVGTFLLCFTVTTAASPSAGGSALTPLSIGGMLMSQVYAGGATSGANYNPAVTLAVFLRRAFAPWETKTAFPLQTAIGYVVMQVAGAGAAGALVLYTTAIVPGYPAPAAAPVVSAVAEGVATFFLITVVLQTATSSKTVGNSFFGLAIGFTVVAMAITIGPISGGAFNPAVGVLGLTTASSLTDLLGAYNWVYAAGPLGGGLVGALVYRVVTFDEFVPPYGYNMV